jgi:hypothetical protein
MFIIAVVKRIFGAIVFLMGLILAGWIAYNLLVERLPETKGRSPIPAMIMTALFLIVGYRWMKGQSA